MTQHNRFTTAAAVLALSLALASPSPASDRTIVVKNSNTSGSGSFAQAILDANADASITRIQFTGKVKTIPLQGTIVFSGPQTLTIQGNDAVIDATGAGGEALLATGGGDLAVHHLTIVNAPQEGIEVRVPSGASGTVRLTLFDVIIRNNGGHGVLVEDQEDPTAPEPPLRPNSGGSPAGVRVDVFSCRFIHNGYTVSDRDGLRVDEGGEGDLTINITGSVFEDNAADGVEVDERGNGDVRVQMGGTLLRGNGPFDPSDLDDGFDIDELDNGSIIGTIALSSALDNYEEGFDFNENDNGDLRVAFFAVEASRNGEEGIDLEEDDDYPADDALADTGDLVSTLALIKANGNKGGDAGVKIREKHQGLLQVTAAGVEADGNGFDGLTQVAVVAGVHIRETGPGNGTAKIGGVGASGNSGNGAEIRESEDGDLTATVNTARFDDNKADGILIREESAGYLVADVLRTQSTGHVRYGVEFRESGAGDLTASVKNSESSFNTLAGVRAEQSSGAGSLAIVNTALASNGGGPTSLVGTTLVP